MIDERTIATYDAAQGPLTVARLVNYGKLRILGENLQEAQIVAQTIYNLGAIESALPDLILHAAEIKAGKGAGSFTAAGTLHLKSKGDLRVSGGTFAADVLQVTSGGKAGIHAFRLDANVKVKAKEVALGADDGNLNIVEQEIDGDPIYYQGVVTNGGNMNISVTNMPGEDVSLWAVGNITVNGPINTLGGDDQHPGRITIVGGQQKVAYNGVENDGLVPCVDCALPFPGLEIVRTPLESNTAVITTGTLTGKSVNVEGGTITTGDILVDNENIPVNFAGNCSLVAATSVKTGNVQVIRREGSTVRKGSMLASAGQNIDIGNVDGGVQAFTTQSGLIKIGNVDAGFGSVFIKAGQDFGGGGGGIIGAAAAQSFTTSLDAKIQTGTLKAQLLVLLMANGNISTGTITLDPEPVSGPSSFVGPHDVRIHANIGRDTAPAFLAGGGGTNGSGQITVTNRSYVAFDGGKAGVIAISNGPNGDIHLNGNRLKCVTGDKGTPGIVADAGSGQIRLVGGSPLSVDGDASHDAGFIILQGGELRAPNAAVVSANDTKPTAETEVPTVILAVDTIALPGSLTVNCNGNTGTSVKLAPKGSSGVDIVNIDYTQPIRPQSVSPVVHELAITGAGSLTLTANSKNGSILCSGDPLRFANQGATHIESEGDGSIIELKFAGSPSGQDSLIFSGGAVEVVADNPQHNGGTIMVTADKVKNTATSVTMHANALSDGAGGSISLDIDRGNLSIGTATGTMSLAATGMGSGAGGTIMVENAKHNGTITLDPTFSMASLNVAALGSNGDGGSIDLHADHLVNNATAGNSGLIANGVGTGKGGHIGLRLTDSITIGGAPGLFMTAISTGSGNGGDVDIVSTQGSVTIDSASLSVTAGTDGRGGKITAKTLQSSSTLTVNGSLTANGQNAKKGGDIKVLAAGMLNISTAEFHANGGPRGAGGSVELSAGADLTVNAGQVTALAGTTGSNKGGDIILTTTGTGDLTVNSSLDVNGSGNADGGLLKLTSAGKANTSDAQLLAKGGSTGGKGGTIQISAVKNVLTSTMNASGKSSGGTISVSSQDAITVATGTPTVALFLDTPPTVDASGGEGNGGQINLTAGSSGTSDLNIQGLLSANSTGSGNGGSVTASSGGNLVIDDGAAITVTAAPSAADGTGGGITAHAGKSMTVIGKLESNGTGNGKGGTILLTSNGTFDIATTGASIVSNGGDGDGQGGVIFVRPTVPMSLSNLSTEVFSARGNNRGRGGDVTLSNIATRDFKVLDVVNIKAGDAAPWDRPEGLGSITINSTKCTQRRLDDIDRAWPTRYWLAKPSTDLAANPTAEDLAPMQLAVEAPRCDKFRDLFGTNKVEIFVFRDYGAYLDFTQDVRDAAAGSITFPLGTFKYVNVWQAGATGEALPNGQPAIKNYTPQQIREVTAHEFGHAYQLSKPVNVAEGSGWDSLKNDDLNDLDNRSSPCDGSNGPFRGVIDLNHVSQGNLSPQTVCDGTALRPDYQGQNRDIFKGLGFNSQFFDIQPKANAELHAQMFALALVGNLGVRPMFDGVIDNGYFPKLKAFAVAQVQQ